MAAPSLTFLFFLIPLVINILLKLLFGRITEDQNLIHGNNLNFVETGLSCMDLFRMMDKLNQ